MGMERYRRFWSKIIKKFHCSSEGENECEFMQSSMLTSGETVQRKMQRRINVVLMISILLSPHLTPKMHCPHFIKSHHDHNMIIAKFHLHCLKSIPIHCSTAPKGWPNSIVGILPNSVACLMVGNQSFQHHKATKFKGSCWWHANV